MKNAYHFFLCLTLLLSLPCVALAADTPSTWAKDEVSATISLNLMPKNLQNNYTQAITRAEFCELIICLANAWGIDIDQQLVSQGKTLNHTAFSDSSAPAVFYTALLLAL